MSMILMIKRFRNLILYGIIGSFTASLDFAIYTLLSSVVGIYYIAANCMSVIVGIVTSFFLNRNYNFKVKDQVARRFSIFLCVGLSGMILSNILLFIFVDILEMNNVVAKLISIVFVVVLQFLLNKFLTFKKS